MAREDTVDPQERFLEFFQYQNLPTSSTACPVMYFKNCRKVKRIKLIPLDISAPSSAFVNAWIRLNKLVYPAY